MDIPHVNFESLQRGHWSETERANARLIADFVQQLMNDHDFEDILQKYGQSDYIQHNRSIPDGIGGLVEFLKSFVKSFPEYSYDVKRILADGDYVVFHSHATLKQKDRGNDKKGLNIIDTWRLKDGQIIEHWDSLQALDGSMRFYALISGGQVRNTNGVF